MKCSLINLISKRVLSVLVLTSLVVANASNAMAMGPDAPNTERAHRCSKLFADPNYLTISEMSMEEVGTQGSEGQTTPNESQAPIHEN